MKIVDGRNEVLGRLAAFVAKEALKGEEIAVVNCEEIVITGSKKDIKQKLEDRRSRIGSGQQGPKISRLNERLVKRAIRGMLPNFREGRGKQAFKRIKCYKKIPKEFEGKDMISIAKIKSNKYVTIKEIGRE